MIMPTREAIEAALKCDENAKSWMLRRIADALDGCVVVPRSPTARMVDAGDNEWRNENIYRIWDAMLAAANKENGNG